MKLKVLLNRLVVGLLLIVIAVPFPAVEAAVIPFTATDESSPTTTLTDGMEIGVQVIDGPPEPPAEYAAERAASIVTSLDRDTTLVNFPSYSWVFGCSAVSAAMIAAYYDNNGYPNMYTGPTNGGAMPITDTSWTTWQDSVGHWYPNNPLIASHSGVDGWVGRGSIDDYWVSYSSGADDPYITNSWPPHTQGTAVGDYMKTSQSAYVNIDGSTHFYTYLEGSNPLTCGVMLSGGVSHLDGTYGRKLFYEARGYTVTDCYNQSTDNYRVGGFSLADFQAEIDTGHPVLLNLDGHSIVGFGYNGTTIYIRDTWSSDPSFIPTMVWDSDPSYQGMDLLSVSIVHIQQPTAQPSAFEKTGPGDGGMGQVSNLILSWETASSAFEYEYCIDKIDNNDCDLSWVSNDVFTSVRLSGLEPDTTYFWQIRANNSEGQTYANGSEIAFWSFTTEGLPGAFNKILPIDEAAEQSTSPTLSWGSSFEADEYEYCYYESGGSCSTWTSTNTNTFIHLSGLSGETTYYWQVRAKNSIGTTYANGSETAFWSFTTMDAPVLSEKMFLPLIVRN